MWEEMIDCEDLRLFYVLLGVMLKLFCMLWIDLFFYMILILDVLLFRLLFFIVL